MKGNNMATLTQNMQAKVDAASAVVTEVNTDLATVKGLLGVVVDAEPAVLAQQAQALLALAQKYPS